MNEWIFMLFALRNLGIMNKLDQISKEETWRAGSRRYRSRFWKFILALRFRDLQDLRTFHRSDLKHFARERVREAPAKCCTISEILMRLILHASMELFNMLETICRHLAGVCWEFANRSAKNRDPSFFADGKEVQRADPLDGGAPPLRHRGPGRRHYRGPPFGPAKSGDWGVDWMTSVFHLTSE